MNPFAKGFRDLIVYQKASGVARRVFELTKPFPKEEIYSLTDQVRRSSRSIGAQIAEAWAKRRYPNHFVSKLTDADGEQNETQHWIDTAVDCGYLSDAQAREINDQTQEIGRMLQSMIDRAEDFQGGDHARVRETPAAYGSLAEFFCSEH
ncbi:MAG: four helix bundle protein [Lentisphaerae bacterium]|nr:four helix bundle protein [Lentisphaerota bacterium]